MAKNDFKVNAAVDILAFLSLIVSLVSGLILAFALPAGEKSGRLSYLGISRFEWISAHNISSLILVALILIHLILHWNWIKCIPEMLKLKLWRKK